MPSVAFAHQNRSEEDGGLERSQFIVDLFYSGDFGRLRFLSELQVYRHEQDMERLQVGWRVTPDTSLWFGRYHNPIGYWNTEHHHGRYMETSAERPIIVAFEDEGGPLPIHLAGFLLQGLHAVGEGVVQYEAGIASGPRVSGDFEPVDVIRDPRFNKLALVARLSWRPDATRDDQYGIFAARTRIPTPSLEFEEIEQDLGGFYLSHELGDLRAFGELFRINHRIAQGTGKRWPSYWAGYGQLEYKIVPSLWTGFARYEGAGPRLDEEYLAVFPRILKQRVLAGVRWDFLAHHALKLEALRDKTFTGQAFHGVEVQWSAHFQ